TAARRDIVDPSIHRSLTGTQTNAEWLLGQGAVRDDVDSNRATTLDVAVDGNTCRFDLTVGDVGRLESLHAVLTEGDAVAALGDTATGGAVLATVLNALRDKHV